jgi:hypothetical protein
MVATAIFGTPCASGIPKEEDFMIQALTGFPNRIVAFVCKGHVTKSDYETVLIPAVERALKQDGAVRFYYQVDADVSAIDPGAMWDDFKVGMEHPLRWERFALVTDIEWIRHTISFFSFMIHGTVKIFHLNEALAAREWISEGMTR